MTVNAERKRDRTVPIIIAVVIIIAGGATVWHKWVRHYVIAKNFGVVEENQIYRTGQMTPRMLRRSCEEHGIRTIIDLSEHTPVSEKSRAEQAVADELGVRRFTFSLEGDGTGDPNIYVDVLRLMADPANQPVLVHCAAGAQRTGAAVLLYRSLVQGESFREAYPETFEHGHKEDEWIMLAYIADNIDEIRRKYNEQAMTEAPRAADASPEYPVPDDS
ncbi:MAG: tyrosine-protein phosphatase [Phycisphaerales bacterium]|nr:tyrosine-protein phosphatase [Phycisphaerales bacterium]